MAVPKAPLSLIGFLFFFFFTVVASQSMSVGVLKSRGGAPGDKACLIALDILGPGSSFGDRLRNAEVLNVGKELRIIEDLLKVNHRTFVGLLGDDAKKYVEDLEGLVGSKLRKVKEQIRHSLDAPAKQDPRDVLEVLANRLRDCMSWCESKKDTEGMSCATKSNNMDAKGFYCFLLA